MAAYEKRDFEAAIELFRGLAMEGDPRAQCMLGLMYYSGEGVARSYTRAYAWINCSAAQNYKDAIQARDLLSKVLKDGSLPMGDDVVDQRSGTERRCGFDRRESTELSYFARGGSQRRKFTDRRNFERRSSPPRR